jgi:pimeloyl-ACP methyl ester carboxylesterase
MAYNETFETIAGCRTRVMRGGQGQPMLFLHGASGAPVWLPFMDKLAERFDLIVPEHPGFGGSDDPEWLDGIPDLAYFYLDAIDHFGLDRLHLMGTSLGGWIAAEMAVRDSHRLSSLTLVAPAGIHVKGVKKPDMFMWSPEETIRNLYFDKSIAERIIPNLPTDEAGQMVILRNRLTTAKLGWSPRMYNPHLYKWLHRVAAPTLIVWGADDVLLPAAYGPAYRDLIPGSRLVTMDRCGHLPHVEQAPAFVETVTRFIQEVAP